MMYQAATFNSAIPTTVGLLAETIRDPKLTDEEIRQQIETAEYEVREIWSKPELILPELVHTAAFKDNTLGNPLLCPQERLGAINRDVIRAYRDAFYRPDRIVVAFAGVPLGALIGAIHASFVLAVGIPLLPAFHPRMASEQHGPTVTRQLEPPGFFALHYGTRTPIALFVAHLVYGAILGGAYQLYL